MSVYFNKSCNTYYVNNDRSQHAIGYGVGKYGKYAKELAEMSDLTGIRYNNYYIHKNDYVIICIYSKLHGYKEVYIDNEDFEKVSKYRWCIIKDSSSTNFYCKCKIEERHSSGYKKTKTLHRYVMDYNGKLIVDHIDGNGLNNRKSNLRIVDISTNNRNQQNRQFHGKSKIYKNVLFRKNRGKKGVFEVNWVDNNGKTKTKSFAVNVYGSYDNALQLAILTSIKMRILNGYLLLRDDSKYLNKTVLHLRRRDNIDFISIRDSLKQEIKDLISQGYGST